MKNTSNIFLTAVLFLMSNNAISNEIYYGIVKSKIETKIVIVSLNKFEHKFWCESALKGIVKAYDIQPNIKVLSSECTKRIGSDYQKAILNKPINGVLYLSFYTEDANLGLKMDSRTLYYNIDKSWFSEQGCNSLIQSSMKSSNYRNPRCIY